MKKKVLSILLVLALLVTMVPAVFAATADEAGYLDGMDAGAAAEVAIFKTTASGGATDEITVRHVGSSTNKKVYIVAYDAAKKPESITDYDTLKGTAAEDLYDENNNQIVKGTDFVLNDATTGEAVITLPSSATGAWVIWFKHDQSSSPKEKNVTLKNGVIQATPLEGTWKADGTYTKVYDGNAFEPADGDFQVTTTPFTGDVKYVYYTKNGSDYTKLTAAPVDVGTYYMRATADNFSEDDDYQAITITKKSVTIAAGTLAVTDKTYDGAKTAATTGAPALTGVVAADATTCTAAVKTAAAFDDADAADGKDVTVVYELTGSKAGNYELADGTISLKGNIKPAAVKLSFAGKDGAEIAEGTLLKDIVVTAKGVNNTDVNGTWEWFDTEDNKLGEDATVASETEYTCVFTPADDETNYKETTGAYQLGQTADPERHEAIMLGRKDTTLFGPDDNLNRAEAATILSRLYGMYTDEEIFDETAVQHAPVGLTDVSDESIWYYAAVGFAQNKNLIEGKTSTSFAPIDKITRAEFATMLARLVAKTKDVPEVDVSQSQLTGISGHWAENAIVYLELNKGGLNGKVGTDFKPNDNLTRAEAAKMVNAVFGRLQSTSTAEEDQLDADLNLFTDVYRNTWYYNNVIEATVGHEVNDPDFRHVQ